MQVQVFERDLTAIRGEGKYRGPIQVRSCDGSAGVIHMTLSTPPSVAHARPCKKPLSQASVPAWASPRCTPMQIQSNALGALEAIDPVVADEIMREGCITGDRINGLCDGVTGDWWVELHCTVPLTVLHGSKWRLQPLGEFRLLKNTEGACYCIAGMSSLTRSTLLPMPGSRSPASSAV